MQDEERRGVKGFNVMFLCRKKALALRLGIRIYGHSTYHVARGPIVGGRLVA